MQILAYGTLDVLTMASLSWCVRDWIKKITNLSLPASHTQTVMCLFSNCVFEKHTNDVDSSVTQKYQNMIRMANFQN